MKSHTSLCFNICISAVILFSSLYGCTNQLSRQAVPGVSKELAESRYSNIKDPAYNLLFEIPSDKSLPVAGTLSLSFRMERREAIILDFKQPDTSVVSVTANGKPVTYKFVNEHIVIPKSVFVKGDNNINITFIAGDQSLNRRDDLMYTLLVPDRARTLFPCFDQPDLKSSYNLSLEIPIGWEGVANGKIVHRDTLVGAGRVFLKFSKTEPIPTYLFSFVAGRMNSITKEVDGRPVTIYHRESEESKIAQCDEIFRQIFSAIKWMEDYTMVKYPFTKYDVVIIPGFQYGGMEHMGATLYSDRTMFLSENATISERLSRAELIAHETAHMWFGDFVTMKWFDEVWTKEVFANWFAKKMVTPLFPEINHELNFLNSYFPAAYAEDRTAGATPVRQELDNLKNAGLVYGNIIYNKAPIVMDKLVRMISEDNFKKGIREYLKKYSYSNATWDNLIEILDRYTDTDLKSWSHVWINEPGMANISAIVSGDSVSIVSSDGRGRHIIWEQPLKYILENSIPIPNTDGRGYGNFILDTKSAGYLMDRLTDYKGSAISSSSMSVINDDVARCSILITLYENLIRGNLDPSSFCNCMINYLPNEENTLLLSRGMSYLSDAYATFVYSSKEASMDSLPAKIENMLWNMAENEDQEQNRTIAYRTYTGVVSSAEGVERLYSIWQSPDTFTSIKLGERELTNLSYILLLHLPERYNTIKDIQLGRISNVDRRSEFKFIIPSLSGSSEVRDSVFKSLLLETNRQVEPWAVNSLSYLNHFTREASSLGYIMPSLEVLEEVQRTGDIFFPRNWLKALLSGHYSTSAGDTVKQFLYLHKDYPAMLRSKILQQSDHLYRLK